MNMHMECVFFCIHVCTCKMNKSSKFIIIAMGLLGKSNWTCLYSFVVCPSLCVFYGKSATGLYVDFLQVPTWSDRSLSILFCTCDDLVAFLFPLHAGQRNSVAEGPVLATAHEALLFVAQSDRQMLEWFVLFYRNTPSSGCWERLHPAPCCLTVSSDSMSNLGQAAQLGTAFQICWSVFVIYRDQFYRPPAKLFDQQ